MKKKNRLLKILYQTVLGRAILKILVSPGISKILGRILDTKISTILIKQTIKKNKIDIQEYEEKKYISFNDFFTRKKKVENIFIDKTKQHFISPCDGNLMVYKIEKSSTFTIKDSKYSLSILLKNEKLAKEYQNGYCMIFRLEVKDYHRYCYIDNGTKNNNIYLKGKLHTVNPISLQRYKTYITNCREYTILNTEHFDKIVQIEVGALLVGKINNLHQAYCFLKGEEKGFFEYGGSTIIVLVKQNIVNIDKNIIQNSKDRKETIVKIGEKIGEKNIE